MLHRAFDIFCNSVGLTDVPLQWSLYKIQDHVGFLWIEIQLIILHILYTVLKNTIKAYGLLHYNIYNMVYFLYLLH